MWRYTTSVRTCSLLKATVLEGRSTPLTWLAVAVRTTTGRALEPVALATNMVTMFTSVVVIVNTTLVSLVLSDVWYNLLDYLSYPERR